jgi:hypothetical protein
MLSKFQTLSLRERALVGSAMAMTLLLAQAIGARAEDATHPTVVELFQSQGCSSCPPAIANVNAISDRADVLALSFAVTYWDSLGWKDTFARQQFTERQWQYAKALRHASVFTPQVVVNGRLDGVGSERSEIAALMRRADRGVQGPTLSIGSDSVQIGASSAFAEAADVWLVRYDARTLEVAVGRGENAGKTLPHKNIVREFIRIGGWSGKAEEFSLPKAADQDLKTAILVQTRGGGPIIAAAKN